MKALLLTLVALCLPAVQEGAPRVSTDDARTSVKRGLKWLADNQHPDGSWASGQLDSLLEVGYALESIYAWQMAAHGLACMALAAGDETPERRETLEKALHWLCLSRLPKRGDDWDIDYVWTMLCGFTAIIELIDDERFAGEEWQAELRKRGEEFYDLLETHQSIDGGWGYYDNPPYPETPMWATSFSTALVIPALNRATELGWEIEPALIKRAVEYVKDCALPNGAYAYDRRPIQRNFGGESINAVKGSLARIQVCNWALEDAGVKWVTDDKIREGLEAFLEHHAWLDVARMKPVPHEAYYANSGYFYFFGHYYAALVIELLPEEERQAWHEKLRYHVIKVQEKDGASTDFQAGSYIRVACTAYAILSLEAGY